MRVRPKNIPRSDLGIVGWQTEPQDMRRRERVGREAACGIEAGRCCGRGRIAVAEAIGRKSGDKNRLRGNRSREKAFFREGGGLSVACGREMRFGRTKENGWRVRLWALRGKRRCGRVRVRALRGKGLRWRESSIEGATKERAAAGKVGDVTPRGREKVAATKEKLSKPGRDAEAGARARE